MILCLSAATIAITAYGPLLMTALHGTPALAAGYVIAVASVSWTVTAVLAAGATERQDPKLIETGTVVVALSVAGFAWAVPHGPVRSEEHTSELQNLMHTSYAVFCWKKKRTPLN